VQFKTGSVPEIEKLWLEWGAGFKKDEFINEFFPFIFDKKYNFLQVDRYLGFQMCKNFQKLTISNYNKDENEKDND
jgi:hypothetical protein